MLIGCSTHYLHPVYQISSAKAFCYQRLSSYLCVATNTTLEIHLLIFTVTYSHQRLTKINDGLMRFFFLYILCKVYPLDINTSWTHFNCVLLIGTKKTPSFDYNPSLNMQWLKLNPFSSGTVRFIVYNFCYYSNTILFVIVIKFPQKL